MSNLSFFNTDLLILVKLGQTPISISTEQLAAVQKYLQYKHSTQNSKKVKQIKLIVY